MSWNSPFGAEVYDRFVREHGLYRRLNERLALYSAAENAARVLDLACGTGATTLAFLELMGARAEIVGVDSSAAMIRIARSNVLDPRARFHILSAGEVHLAPLPAFDRVVCNAAFWQFPNQHRVLSGVARILTRGGCLVFNVPADHVLGSDTPVHPFQIALAREFQQWNLAQPEPPRAFSLSQLIESCADFGLALQRHERAVLPCRQKELMTIPPLVRPITPALSDEERMQLVEHASRHVDPDEEVPVTWHFFSFERIESDKPSLSHVLDEPGTSYRGEELSCSISTW